MVIMVVWCGDNGGVVLVLVSMEQRKQTRQCNTQTPNETHKHPMKHKDIQGNTQTSNETHRHPMKQTDGQTNKQGGEEEEAGRGERSSLH